jgi:stage II sporulation protein D
VIGPGALALVLVLGAPGDGLTEELSVRILGRIHPTSVRLSRSGEAHVAAVSGEALWIDGRPGEGGRSFPPGRWRVEADGGPARQYVGAVTVWRDGGEVAVVVRLALEEYVASVVAAETEQGTPFEALKALAVVARSYGASARGRHEGADLCDLAHCQVMGAAGAGAHRASAEAAARATSGEVLRVEDGRVAVAPFHAACGGHTADPAEVFGGEGTGASAVPDPGCGPAPWQVQIEEHLLARIAGSVLAQGNGDRAPVPIEALRFLRGKGGHVIQVAGTGSAVGGEAFTRAIDRALGHGRVRSARFEVRRSGSALRVIGSGIGHGVGLCQAGAARRAAEGQGYGQILRHFFPQAHLDPAALRSDPAGQPAPRWAPLNRTSSR